VNVFGFVADISYLKLLKLNLHKYFKKYSYSFLIDSKLIKTWATLNFAYLSDMVSYSVQIHKLDFFLNKSIINKI
jgi:hypothetical protein